MPVITYHYKFLVARFFSPRQLLLSTGTNKSRFIYWDVFLYDNFFAVFSENIVSSNIVANFNKRRKIEKLKRNFFLVKNKDERKYCRECLITEEHKKKQQKTKLKKNSAL